MLSSFKQTISNKNCESENILSFANFGTCHLRLKPFTLIAQQNLFVWELGQYYKHFTVVIYWCIKICLHGT
jgi:hypothetical protein